MSDPPRRQGPWRRGRVLPFPTFGPAPPSSDRNPKPRDQQPRAPLPPQRQGKTGRDQEINVKNLSVFKPGSKSPVVCAALLCGAAAVGGTGLLAQAADAKPGILTKVGASLEFYGSLRVDTIFNDARFNDNQLAVRVLSSTPLGVASANNVQDDLTIHGRLTRLGMNFNAGKVESLWDASLTGNLEMDFYGGDAGGAGGLPSDSRNLPRMRRAVMKLSWDNAAFSAGQDWDVIAPLNPAVNADMVMWNAGNLGDRRPMLRGDFWTESGDFKLTATAALGLTGAITNIQTSAAAAGGISSGEISSIPQIQGRLGAEFKWNTLSGGEGKQAIKLGAWSHYAREKADTAIAGRTMWTAYSLGMDLFLPLYDAKLSLSGEAFTGKNLADVRGGIGQGINAGTGDEIMSRGGWAQLNYKLDDTFTFHLGYSVDDPVARDLAADAVAGNNIAYLAAIASFGKAVTVGAEWQEWVTHYQGPSGKGEATRFRIYFAYNF